MQILRVITLNPLFAFVNIAGLAIGLAVCVLILLFVREELSYDDFWPESERIYRFHTQFAFPNLEPLETVRTMGPLKNALDKDLPEIESVARLSVQRPTLRFGDRVFVDDVGFADPEFIELFGFQPLAGSIDVHQGDSSAFIITRSLAEKYFGTENPIGQVATLTVRGTKREYRIVAVIPDLPGNTHMDFSGLVLIDELKLKSRDALFESWTSGSMFTYARLEPGAGAQQVEARLGEILDNNVPPLAIGLNAGLPSDLLKLSMMPIGDIQLHARGVGEMKPNGDINAVRTFVAIALLILAIACFNFMNLATAKSTERAQEVALRKLLGARRSALVFRFLGESVLMSGLGLGLALVMVAAVLPWYRAFTGKAAGADVVFDPATWLAVVGLTAVVGIAGGIYPAFFQSRFRPAETLKAGGSAGDTAGSLVVRQGLVLLQFAISTALFVAIAIVYGQLLYVDNADLGFEKKNMLLVHRLQRPEAFPLQEVFKRNVAKLPGVLSVARSDTWPGDDSDGVTEVRLPGSAGGDNVLISQRTVDEDFLATYGIKLLAGRDFDKARPTDFLPIDPARLAPEFRVAGVIANQAALGHLGLGTADEALGKKIILNPNAPLTLTVVGVVANAHFDSLKSALKPEIYLANRIGFRVLGVRYHPDADPTALAVEIERTWRTLIPGIPFLYQRLDDVLAGQYEKERVQATLLAGFAGLAVLVACLGLYGVSVFTAHRRTREIAVRKILGAGVFRILQLLLWQTSKPVLFASLIAGPVAVYFMRREWLSQYRYHFDIAAFGIAICLSAVLLALVLSWVTVGGHAAKAARSRPIEALRHE